MKRIQSVGVVIGVALLASCAPKKPPLPGERFDTRTPLSVALAENAKGEGDLTAKPAPNRAVPLRLGAAVNNANWPQRNGGPEHRMTQPALAANPSLAWSVSIGQGDDKRHRISTVPVVDGGRIFTIDSRATVSATSTSGAHLWSVDLTPPADQRDDASGGGLASGGGKLFATSDFGELVALDPATGTVIWRQKFGGPVTGTPTYADGSVYVMSRDGSGWAINATDGKIRWQYKGVVTIGGQLGGAGPAVADRLVLLPFPSGELAAVLRDGGASIWANSIAGSRLGQAYAGLQDFSGDPVVVGNSVFVGNASGRTEAIDLSNGTTRWTADFGALSPVWPADGALFLVSDNAKLVRLDAATGKTVWAVDLPYYVPTRKPKQRKDIYAHYGPILAGGRLLIASNDGQVREYDPASGALLTTMALPGGASADPVVAGGTLYIVTSDGQLHAFR